MTIPAAVTVSTTASNGRRHLPARGGRDDRRYPVQNAAAPDTPEAAAATTPADSPPNSGTDPPANTANDTARPTVSATSASSSARFSVATEPVLGRSSRARTDILVPSTSGSTQGQLGCGGKVPTTGRDPASGRAADRLRRPRTSG